MYPLDYECRGRDRENLHGSNPGSCSTPNKDWRRVLSYQTRFSNQTCQVLSCRGNCTTATAYNAVTWNVALNGSTKHLSHNMAG